jgi:threonine dehydratase
VTAASGGNHGAAVAFAARARGVKAKIFVPTVSSPAKVERIRGYGAELVVTGDRYADALAASETWVAQSGSLSIHAFDQTETMLGTGTLGCELERQAGALDTVLVAVGGGGLIAGVAAAVKQSNPKITVVGVEPAGAPKMSQSMAAGHPITLESTSSIADGLMPVRPGDLTFEHVRAFVDEVVTVTDDDIARAALWMFYEAKQVVEPSGAATVAALLWPKAGSRLANTQARAVAILSGGNVAPETLAALEHRGR